MGSNSVIFLCNDGVGSIERDPKGWWQRTWDALTSLSGRAAGGVEYGFGGHANGFRAVWNRHADNGGLIYVGGNRAMVLASRHGAWKGDETDIINLLSDVAKEHGYKVVKAEKRP